MAGARGAVHDDPLTGRAGFVDETARPFDVRGAPFSAWIGAHRERAVRRVARQGRGYQLARDPALDRAAPGLERCVPVDSKADREPDIRIIERGNRRVHDLDVHLSARIRLELRRVLRRQLVHAVASQRARIRHQVRVAGLDDLRRVRVVGHVEPLDFVRISIGLRSRGPDVEQRVSNELDAVRIEPLEHVWPRRGQRGRHLAERGVRRDDLRPDAREGVQEEGVASGEMEGHGPSVVVRDDAFPRSQGCAFPQAPAPTIAPKQGRRRRRAETARSIDRTTSVGRTGAPVEKRTFGRSRNTVLQAVRGRLWDRRRQVRHDRRAQGAADPPVAEQAIVRQQRQAAGHSPSPRPDQGGPESRDAG